VKLITLNIWGGHVKDPLLKFIKTHRDTDIFCLQEVYHKAEKKISNEERFIALDIFSEIEQELPSHLPFFRPVVNGIYGIGMLIKKEIAVLAEGECEIYDNPSYMGLGPTHSRNLQWTQCKMGEKTFTVINVHGLWNGKGKTDAPERILQSQKIKSFLDGIKTPKILCGDLNLRPDTESIKILEKGMRNLIHHYNIKSTRTSLYPKEERFADYVFTSPEIQVNRFHVLEDEVSDHSPLLLDFS
jgi:endonuclease/exonuclease/phosphatase family metal-dependent hydrolase